MMSEPNHDGPRLLIVDESPSICATLEHILQYYGYDTCATTDGVSALVVLLREQFDMLLIEPRLPGRVDGRTLIQIAVDQQPNAAIMLLTGSLDLAQPDDRIGLRRYQSIDKTASPAAIATAVALAQAPHAERQVGLSAAT
jgi:DNA-binding NtrC family response regulator